MAIAYGHVPAIFQEWHDNRVERVHDANAPPCPSKSPEHSRLRLHLSQKLRSTGTPRKMTAYPLRNGNSPRIHGRNSRSDGLASTRGSASRLPSLSTPKKFKTPRTPAKIFWPPDARLNSVGRRNQLRVCAAGAGSQQ